VLSAYQISLDLLRRNGGLACGTRRATPVPGTKWDRAASSRGKFGSFFVAAHSSHGGIFMCMLPFVTCCILRCNRRPYNSLRVHCQPSRGVHRGDKVQPWHFWPSCSYFTPGRKLHLRSARYSYPPCIQAQCAVHSGATWLW